MKVTKLEILLFAVLLAAPAANGAERVERRLRAMGTELRIIVDGPGRAEAIAASEHAAQAVWAAEARLSTWLPDSETSRFNAGLAGEPVPISPLLKRDLSDALRCSVETRGAFTPGLGRLVQAWGLRVGGRRPDDAEIEAVLPALHVENLVLEQGTATRLDPRFIIEEGAFGKGVGLDDALSALTGTPASAAVLDLGGQVAVWGEAAVTVEVADPRDRWRVALNLDVRHGSVATTGNSERGIVVDGKHLGHVLDPATGRPSEDFGSLTVWTERAVRADCLSTALYVMGPARALDWAAGRPDVGVVVVEAGERGLLARASANLRGRLQPATADVKLLFQQGSTARRPAGQSGRRRFERRQSR